MMFTILLACALIAQDPPKAGPGPATVPFELLPSNHMVVMAALNDKEPGRYIFDLGAPVTLVTGKAAGAAGLVDDKAPRLFLFGARGDAKVKAFHVGGLTAKGLPVLVMDHPAVQALGRLTGKPLDGLVGYTFFARFRTTIDYQAKTMTLEPVDFEVKDLFQTLPQQIAGPKAAKRTVLAPAGLWGLTLGEPSGGVASAGLPVTAVAPGSAAAEAGLRAGDFLTTLDGRWATSVADAYTAAAGVEPGRPAEAVVRRGGEELTLRVTPRAGL